MTGGSDARRVAANSTADEFLGMISIVTEGTFEPGKVPPPAFALPRPIPMVAGNPCKLEEIATARARNASSGIFKTATVGISPIF